MINSSHSGYFYMKYYLHTTSLVLLITSNFLLMSVIVERRTATRSDTGSHNWLDLIQVLYQHTMYIMGIYPTVSSISRLALINNQ